MRIDSVLYRKILTKTSHIKNKVDDKKKVVTVYTVADQSQDYLSIIRGL